MKTGLSCGEKNEYLKEATRWQRRRGRLRKISNESVMREIQEKNTVNWKEEPNNKMGVERTDKLRRAMLQVDMTYLKPKFMMKSQKKGDLIDVWVTTIQFDSFGTHRSKIP
ncbi:hypothetical protein WA026_012183 [Henosepilachna vigintioctopunctata]|uniref:Uncharacterized protein n=1 Tax=Henosepilachna vigintioctopunctata TaxID=420089 RepID=A0AAW1VFL7_9CUCU